MIQGVAVSLSRSRHASHVYSFPQKRITLRRWLPVVALTLASGAFCALKYSRGGGSLEQVRAALREFDSRRAMRLLKTMDAADRSGEIAYLTAIACRQGGQIADAVEALRLARRRGYDTGRIKQQEKLLAFQSGDVDETKPYLLNWLAQSPNDDDAAQIYDCLVRGYLAAVRPDEAAYCIDLWLRWKPAAIRPLWLRTDVERTERDYAKTTATYREIVRRTPDDAQARFELGRLLVDNNDAAAAREHLEWYHQRRPEDAQGLVYLAKCRRRLGAAEDALALLKKSFKQEMADELRAEALVELGQIQIKEESAQVAQATLRRAIELAPANAAAHYALGLAMARLNQKAEAARHFAESERIESQNARLADLARELIHRPDDANIRCEAGEILLDLGRMREARIWLASALYYDAEHEPARRALARCDEHHNEVESCFRPGL